MVRAGYWAGVSVTVRVAPGATLTWRLTRMTRWPLPGVTMAAPNVPLCSACVVLLTAARTVSAELVRPGLLASSTCALPSASGPATRSCTGNWMPVLLSGGIWFQSTSSTVYMVFGSFGCTSMATVFGPGLTSRPMAKVNRV